MRRALVAMTLLTGLLVGCTSDGPSGYALVSTWGATGRQPGQLREPMGVAVDGQGDVYVADTRNGRVQKFTPDGRPVMVFGAPGDGPGQLIKPVDVAVDQSGAVYAVDFDLDRVVVFGADGGHLRSWGVNGTGPGQFRAATGIAVNGEGNVYVADFYNHRIHVFDAAGSLLKMLGTEELGDGQLHYPTDVAFDSEGGIYAADAYNYRVQKWAADGTFVAAWGGQGSARDQLDVPSGVAVDDNGVVHIADSGNRRVVARAADGRVIDLWELGETGGPLNTPVRVAVRDDLVYLADTANDKVLTRTRYASIFRFQMTPGSPEAACGSRRSCAAAATAISCCRAGEHTWDATWLTTLARVLSSARAMVAAMTRRAPSSTGHRHAHLTDTV